MLILPPDYKEPLKYVGFWKRLAAMLLDMLVTLPLVLLFQWGSQYRLFQAYYLVPGIIFCFFYNVYLVKRYGGTPGKLLVRIRIAKVNGEPVTYREALLRYAPEMILSFLVSISLICGLLHMTDIEYSSFSLIDRAKRLAQLEPWGEAVKTIYGIWVWSELLVLLTNKKRRALHDFIAGTVVVEKSHRALPEYPVGAAI